MLYVHRGVVQRHLLYSSTPFSCLNYQSFRGFIKNYIGKMATRLLKISNALRTYSNKNSLVKVKHSL